MKSTGFALTISFSFLLFFSLFTLLPSTNYARKTPEAFWKEVMKDEPMPDAIKGLLMKDATETDLGLVGDFDVKPNVIIYHGRHEDKTEREQGPKS